MPIAQLFKPKEDIGKLAGEISNQPPIPMEEFTVEEVVDMWKQFEIKYLGKK
jgi:hypothetical protein